MGEMVERVAQAIYEASTECEMRKISWRDAAKFLKEESRKFARAAIAEMREPTEAMIEASNREWDGRMSYRSSGAWQATIDAALAKDSTTPHKAGERRGD